MNMIDRVKNIVLTPATEWPVIAEEPSSTGSLIAGYVAPLAAISALAGFIGGSIVGRSGIFTGTYRIPFTMGLALAVYTFVGAIVGVVLIALIINALAPTFGGEKNSVRAMKVAAYSFTPAWVAGVLQIIPALGVLGLLAGLYGLYLLYLGLPVLMKAPKDKAAGYTVVTVICAIVVMVVVGSVGTLVIGAGALGSGLMGGASTPSPTADVPFDKDSPLVGLASWATLQTSKEDQYGSERVSKVNGRMVHEKTSRNGADGYAIVLGERFVVSGSSTDVKLAQLKTIVSALDLNKLESMKDVGVQKK